jgi:hypothetical protein
MKKGLTVAFFTVAMLIGIISYQNYSAKATTTYWYKIAPSTCAIWTINSDPSEADNSDAYGTMSILSSVSGAVTINAQCPVEIPHGAAMDLLRIRTFQGSGIPANTDVTVKLKRRTWDGSTSTLATAYMGSSDTYNDAAFTSTVDNGAYHYTLQLSLYKASNAATMPQLGMMEVRYGI